MGGMKKREECVGKNETRKDVRRKGGGGGEQEVVIQIYTLTKTIRGLKTTSWRCNTTAFSSSSTERLINVVRHLNRCLNSVSLIVTIMLD